jgi:hypothetical protein
VTLRWTMFAREVPDSGRLGVRLGGSHPEVSAAPLSCIMLDGCLAQRESALGRGSCGVMSLMMRTSVPNP